MSDPHSPSSDELLQRWFLEKSIKLAVPSFQLSSDVVRFGWQRHMALQDDARAGLVDTLFFGHDDSPAGLQHLFGELGTELRLARRAASMRLLGVLPARLSGLPQWPNVLDQRSTQCAPARTLNVLLAVERRFLATAFQRYRSAIPSEVQPFGSRLLEAAQVFDETISESDVTQAMDRLRAMERAAEAEPAPPSKSVIAALPAPSPLDRVDLAPAPRPPKATHGFRRSAPRHRAQRPVGLQAPNAEPEAGASAADSSGAAGPRDDLAWHLAQRDVPATTLSRPQRAAQQSLRTLLREAADPEKHVLRAASVLYLSELASTANMKMAFRYADELLHPKTKEDSPARDASNLRGSLAVALADLVIRPGQDADLHREQAISIWSTATAALEPISKLEVGGFQARRVNEAVEDAARSLLWTREGTAGYRLETSLHALKDSVVLQQVQRGLDISEP